MLTKIHHARDRRHVGRRDHGRAARPRRPRAASCPPPLDGGAATAQPGELEMLGARAARPAALPAAAAARAAGGAAEPRRDTPFGDAARARARVGAAGGPASQRARRRRRRPRSSARASRRRSTSFNGRISPHRRFAFGQLLARRGQGGQERARLHGQRRRRRDLRRRGAALADRARRAARRAARRPDPGVGAHRASRWAPTATGSC